MMTKGAWKFVLVGLAVVGLAGLAVAQPVPRLEFSLDIGSDVELSDPFPWNEWSDPGDVYEKNQWIVGPTNGFKDDTTIFGVDPSPDPLTGTVVPVGQGDPSLYPYYFDLDGHDQLDFELPEYLPYQPQVLLAKYLLPTPCVVVPSDLIFSYDDDGPPGWPVADVPVTVPPTHGMTAAGDELLTVPYPVPPVIPAPYADEVNVHGWLAPNPDLGEYQDDDVDSLDLADPRCNVWYFTADHEANLGLDPGDIYRVFAGGGLILAVDDVVNLGLKDDPTTDPIEDADVDAFEFIWAQMPTAPGTYALAVLFSVDQDDPLTPGVDESGGLIPSGIYISFLDGYHWQVADLGENVDALTVEGDVLPPPAIVFEFSLDIGSDHELSDPQLDNDNWFDPGDVYLPSQVIWAPTDGFKNDWTIFNLDPPPTPGVAGSEVPVGQGDPSWYPYYFDLDGHDQLAFDLREVTMHPPIPVGMLPSTRCVYEPTVLYWSYDDDKAAGWPANDVPVTVPSPAGFVYGSTALADEVIGAQVVPAIPSALLTPPIGVANELMVNFSLWPNPDPPQRQRNDDDVDSLDAQCEQHDCWFWYFTVDHEATWFNPAGGPLDPGDIYLANPVIGIGPVLIVDNNQLGLPDGTDVDAFEFALLEHPWYPGGLYLAVLFSVDDDDPLTAVDESGGLNPNEIYASFLDGLWWDFLVLDDDVDALTIFPRDPVKAPNLIPNTGGLYPPEPALDGTLPKTRNNVFYLVFDEAIAIGAGAPVTIQQLFTSVPENLGPDLAGAFTFSVVSTNIINDTVKGKENGPVLANWTWYRIKPTANLTNAAGTVAANLFVVDLVTLRGDSDSSKQVLAQDYFPIKNNLFQFTDNRYDLDGNGQVLAQDYFVVKNNLFAVAPPKP